MQRLIASLFGTITLLLLTRQGLSLSDHAFVYGSSLSAQAAVIIENYTLSAEIGKDPEQIPLLPPKGSQITLSKIDVKMMLKYAIIKPGSGQLLFYSSGAGPEAKKLVKNEFYDAKNPIGRFYDLLEGCRYHFALTGPEKEANEASYQRSDAYKYFQIMSTTLAYLANEKATIMSQTPNNIPQDGIWALNEFPTMTRPLTAGERPEYGVVNRIDVVDEFGSFSHTLWTRGGSAYQRFTNNMTMSSNEPDLACPGRPEAWPQYLIDFWEGHDVEG